MPTVSKGAMRFFKTRVERLLRAVPTLDLRRKQLNREILVWEEELEKLEVRYALLQERMEGCPHPEVERIVHVDRVEMGSVNIAGVILEEVKDVTFRPIVYSLISTPPSFDVFVGLRRELLEAEKRLEMKRRALDILLEELLVTTQRINLFEKRMIPNFNEQIRYIKGRLEDGERSSVMVAKIAQKERLSEQTTSETA